MAWDEKLFSWFYDDLLLRKKKKEMKSSCVNLEQMQKRLQILSSAIAERNIEIRSSHSWGGLQGNILFLPEEVQFSENQETHIDYYIWRALTSALALQNKTHDYKEWILLVQSEYPMLQELYQRLLVFFPENNEALWGHLPIYQNHFSSDETSKQATLQKRNSIAKDSEVKARTVEKATLHQITEENESPLTHVFEKVHTVEDYQGGDRKMDGSDEILEHQNALNDVMLSHVIRTNRTTESIAKSNAIIEIAQAELEHPLVAIEKTYLYPEWFSAEKRYRNNWCHLYESNITGPSIQIDFSKKQAHQLRMKLQHLFNEPQWQLRQLDGSELDLASIIDRSVQLHTKGTPTERIYQQQRRKHRNLASLILIDSSLSTESWLQEEQILNLMKKSLLTIQAAFRDTTDPIAIASFYSNTRHHCHFQMIKDFDEDWSDTQSKIGQLQSTGYTRIGPALRHAQFLLEQTHARKKLLLLLSDAKPTDYDQYEGRHGIQDIQKAVHEGQASGQLTKVLGFVEKGQSHHENCFGAGNFYPMKNEHQMSEQLFQIWSHAIKS